MSLWGWLAWIGLGLWLLCPFLAYSQEKPPEKPWTGKLADGRVITQADLDQILQDHKLWVQRGNAGEGKVNLHRAILNKVNLSGAILTQADLSATNLQEANLSGTNLRGANLSKAGLWRTDLSGADLWGANLSGAILFEADLSETNLTGTGMLETIFEPKKGGFLPDVRLLSGVLGLHSLKYVQSPHGLVTLREVYKRLGERENERSITYAIYKTKRELNWQQGNIMDSMFNLIFFEWTCAYGMIPGAPLQFLGLCLLLFTLPYLLALRSRDPETGIWLLLTSDRVLHRKLKDHPIKLTLRPPFRPLPVETWARFSERLWRICRALRLALYFSLLSAFHLGWRELNVGTWISRLQKREYNLRATGWVRTVSGLQSLLSIYMLALWALTYFGRPFE
jgi:hypothetical protein